MLSVFYTERHVFDILMLSVIILSVVVLNVVRPIIENKGKFIEKIPGSQPSPRKQINS
jgi:hypothetical protein